MYDHAVLKSLLGAWALAASSPAETRAVEEHLSGCAACAEEALRLRDAVGLLHPEDNLDLDPRLRSRVLEGCLERRRPRTPVPEWAAPYDAETARLDALLRDMAADEWRAPVRLRWFEDERQTGADTTVSGVIAHLLAVDGLLAGALGLPDPLGDGPEERSPDGPDERTTALWRSLAPDERPSTVLGAWREQSHSVVRTVSFAPHLGAERELPYRDLRLPLRDAFLERAFECWVHAGDIAEAVDYPHGLPLPEHLHQLVDLSVRLLTESLAGRRRSGLAAPPRRLAAVGAPGRTLRLEVEGSGGGLWHVPLDSPGAASTEGEEVAHIALDCVEFCQLAAGHVPPRDAAAGQEGDPEAIREVLFAAASLSHL
ncbi:zf-HC2 domain-containing protein [Streptomyces sp. AJS327]|uniref:zf-HC2 domain-containing protein n=1 Tax=Streptomyces sp. AJS327 TaxID=2545265 RepID=UPI0035B56643